MSDFTTYQLQTWLCCYYLKQKAGNGGFVQGVAKSQDRFAAEYVVNS
jgi:hypothetical protein